MLIDIYTINKSFSELEERRREVNRRGEVMKNRATDRESSVS